MPSGAKNPAGAKSNRALFSRLQSLVLTLGGLGEFSKVIQTRDKARFA